MRVTPQPIRIEPAFADRQQIRAMFERHAPYRALAVWAPDGLDDVTDDEAGRPVVPWFRGDWALDGKPLVDGAELILHNKRFLDAAKSAFGTSRVYPELVVANITGPMAACTTHVDNPSFHGTTRLDYPLPFLRVMGFSGLFDTWRVPRATAITWFYEGPGGSFDYWPLGIDGPMRSESPPFGNVALIADMDRMYHRIGSVGEPAAAMPRMSAAAQICPDSDGNWVIVEQGEVRATYPSRAIRLTALWKAAVGERDVSTGNLNLDRIMEIFTSDLRQRRVEFAVPSDPLANRAWILLLQRTYGDPANRQSGPRATARYSTVSAES